MANDSSSGFRQGYHTFLYGHIKYNREGGRKRTNEQTRTWVSSNRKKGSFVTLFILRASVDYHGHVFCAKIFTKATRNANSSLTVFPHCLHLLTVLPLDCYLTPTGLFCRSPSSFVNWPSVFSGTFLSSSTSGLTGDLALSPLCGFRAKAKRFSDRRAHTHPILQLYFQTFIEKNQFS